MKRIIGLTIVTMFVMAVSLALPAFAETTVERPPSLPPLPSQSAPSDPDPGYQPGSGSESQDDSVPPSQSGNHPMYINWQEAFTGGYRVVLSGLFLGLTAASLRALYLQTANPLREEHSAQIVRRLFVWMLIGVALGLVVIVAVAGLHQEIMDYHDKILDYPNGAGGDSHY